MEPHPANNCRRTESQRRDPSQIVVVGFGEALFDRKVSLDFYRRIKSRPDCDRAIYTCDREKDYDGRDDFGGAPINCIGHLCMLGFKAYAVTAVADDRAGRKILRTIRRMKIRAAVTRYGRPEECGLNSGIVLVHKKKNGNDFYIPSHAAWDHIALTPALKRLAARTDLICFGTLAQRLRPVRGADVPFTRTTLREFLLRMREDSFKVFDVNLRQNHHSKKLVEESILLCNVLKISDGKEEQTMKRYIEMPPQTSSEEFCRMLLQRYPNLKMVIFTAGSKGNSIYERTQAGTTEEYHYRITSDQAAETERLSREHDGNTVGAGDSFSAAFFAMLLRGYGIEAAQEFASRLAAFVCTRSEATPDYSQSPELTARIASLFK